VDEEGAEDVIWHLGLGLTTWLGKVGARGTWCNAQKNTLAFLRPPNVTGVLKMALGSWLTDAAAFCARKATVSERPQSSLQD